MRHQCDRIISTMSTNKKTPGDPQSTEQVKIDVRPQTKRQKPSLYKVLLLNDDFTPMDFVIMILETIFGKNRAEATRIMLNVHKKGIGLCGVYTYEVAETKAALVLDAARAAEHPLQCALEKAS
jgi:ATP-dependent Clp protease adaptor protein ClpS